MNIMKTITGTLFTISALGLFGLMNINAISDTKKAVANDKAEMSAIEVQMTDDAIFYSARVYSDSDFSIETGAYAPTVTLAEESILSDEAVNYSARAYSDTDIENETEENATDQILQDENVMINEVNYSAKAFSDIDFENEIKSRE